MTTRGTSFPTAWDPARTSTSAAIQRPPVVNQRPCATRLALRVLTATMLTASADATKGGDATHARPNPHPRGGACLTGPRLSAPSSATAPRPTVASMKEATGTMKKILVGTDTSASADIAVEAA